VARVTGRNENRSQKPSKFIHIGCCAGVHETWLECAPITIRIKVVRNQSRDVKDENQGDSIEHNSSP
jgi:hypothetical protein